MTADESGCKRSDCSHESGWIFVTGSAAVSREGWEWERPWGVWTEVSSSQQKKIATLDLGILW